MELSLDRFIVCKNTFLFDSNDQKYFTYQNKLQNFSEEKTYQQHFMKNRKSLKTRAQYDQFCLQKFNDTIKENILTSNLDFSVYYEYSKPFKNIVYEVDNKVYCLQNEKFTDQLKNNYYQTSELNNLIENYVKNTYNSQYINQYKKPSCKNLPIYSIDQQTLDNLNTIYIGNQTLILNLLSSFNLNQISSKILYNFQDDKLNTLYFDSIKIEPILEVLTGDVQQQSFFNQLFANLPYDSFIRFFNPIGRISNIIDDSIKPISSISQYMYYSSFNDFTVKSQNNLSLLNSNEFSLKCLETPDGYYDYYINNIPSSQFNSYYSKIYIEQSDKYFSYNYFNNFIKNLKGIINSSFFYNSYKEFINDYNIQSALFQKICSTFTNWSQQDISSYINCPAGSGLLMSQLESYLDENYEYNRLVTLYGNTSKEQKYNLLTNSNIYLLTKDKIINFYNESIINIIENRIYFKNYYTNVLNSISQSLTKIQNLSVHYYTNFQKLIFNSQYGIKWLKDQCENLQNQIKNIFGKMYLNRYLAKQISGLTIQNTDNRINISELSGVTFNNMKYLESFINSYESKNKASIIESLQNEFKMYRNTVKFQNSMQKEGYLFGYRNYTKLKSLYNEDEKIWLKYNYNTKFDLRFFKENVIFNNFNFYTKKQIESQIRKIELKNLVENMVQASKNNVNFQPDFTIDGHLTSINQLDNSKNNIVQLDQNKFIIVEKNNVQYLTKKLHLLNSNFNFYTKQELLLKYENNLIFGQNINDLYTFKNNDQDVNLAYNINKNINIYILIQKNENLINEIIAFLNMLQQIKNYEFVDIIKGYYKYKDTTLSKSNIYSIQLTNSNLNYTLYQFEQVCKICYSFEFKDSKDQTFNSKNYRLKSKKLNNKNYYYFQNENNSSDIYDVYTFVKKCGFKEIIDTTQNQYNEGLSKLQNSEQLYDKDPYSYKYYKYKEQKNLKLKMKIRTALQKSIRNSIDKYMPVNTSLWKIIYKGT